MFGNDSEFFLSSGYNTCIALPLALQLNLENTNLVFHTNIITCVLNSIFSLTAITGNILVLLSILTLPSLRSQPCNVVLCSLAMADFLVGIIVQPSYVVYKVAELTQRWDLMCFGKLVHASVGFATTGASLLSLMAIALERVLAVNLHLRYREIVTSKRVSFVLLSFWITSILVSFLSFKVRKAFEVIVAIVELVIIFITSLAYHNVYKTVQRHRKAINSHNISQQLDVEKYKKSAMTMFLVFMFSLFCYLPFVIFLALNAVYGFKPMVKAFANYATTLICITSSCNPLIYCLRMQEVRKAVVRLIKGRGASVQNASCNLQADNMAMS